MEEKGDGSSWHLKNVPWESLGEVECDELQIYRKRRNN